MSGRVVKRALIRDLDVPVGLPASRHVRCGCGGQPVLAESGPTTCAGCGTVYDAEGCILDEPGGSCPPYRR